MTTDKTYDIAIVGGGLYAREVEYLVTREWAKTAQDILWRRTKLGLRLTKPQVERLSSWLQNYCAHNGT